MIYSAGGFNLIEAVVWIIIGVVVFSALNKPAFEKSKKEVFIGGVLFIFFGISDIFEIYSGAWWKPWCLYGKQ